ncbi:hypothetical protein Baya_11073 [Bagarius yarrelli]|uniref:Uncharacterized protein n=1 Tax=Bagarius yarrelli TaxID=175774 RepID=A0A556UZ34_BAGYA|nr:hypothetical protein Baya_11073 [Bagarius yarrelli]
MCMGAPRSEVEVKQDEINQRCTVEADLAHNEAVGAAGAKDRAVWPGSQAHVNLGWVEVLPSLFLSPCMSTFSFLEVTGSVTSLRPRLVLRYTSVCLSPVG